MARGATCRAPNFTAYIKQPEPTAAGLGPPAGAAPATPISSAAAARMWGTLSSAEPSAISASAVV